MNQLLRTTATTLVAYGREGTQSASVEFFSGC